MNPRDLQVAIAAALLAAVSLLALLCDFMRIRELRRGRQAGAQPKRSTYTTLVPPPE